MYIHSGCAIAVMSLNFFEILLFLTFFSGNSFWHNRPHLCCLLTTSHPADLCGAEPTSESADKIICGDIVLETFLTSLWMNYPACICLKNCFAALNVPKQPTFWKKSTLLVLFGAILYILRVKIRKTACTKHDVLFAFKSSACGLWNKC